MKLQKSLIILILSLLCSLCFFGACQKSNKIVELNIKQYSAQMPIEVPMGKFIYENYTLVISYSNGGTKEIPLSQDMIEEADKLAFYKEGLHTIKVTYQDKSVDLIIDVKRNEFEEAVFENLVTTYTGQDVTIQVGGNIPSGTTILYPQGNVFSQAGEYEVSAVLIRDTFVTKKLYATLTINKADYDLSKANLYDKTTTYNGENHFIELQGVLNETVNKYTQYELPNGVTFDYTINGEEGNSAKEAGVYTVTASFKGDNTNYNLIPNKTATLTIQKASFDISDINFSNKTEVYNGYEKTLEITNKEFLPNGVIVSYEVAEVKNASLESIANAVWQKGNSKIDAGLYAVRANFSPDSAHAKNYEAPKSQIAFLKIEKADFDTSDLTFEPSIFWYTPGVEYYIEFSQDLPLGIERVDYTIRRLIDGVGNIVLEDTMPGNKATDAGLYYLVATFVLTEAYAKNFNANPSYIESYMSIEQAEIDLTNARLDSIETEYAEEGFDLQINGLPEVLGYDYKILDENGVNYNKQENYNEEGRLVLNVGEYTSSLDIYVTEENLNNYRIIGDNCLKGSFVVRPKQIDLQTLNFKNTTVLYQNGKNHSLAVIDCPSYLGVTYKSAEVSQIGESVSVWSDNIQHSKEGIFAYKAIVEVLSENYTLATNEIVRYLTIFDLGKIDFNLQSCQKVYSGEKYELALPIELPNDISVEYKIYCNGQEVDSAIEVGEYTFTAIFGGVAQGEENKTATLTITPKPYDLQGVVADMESSGLLNTQTYSFTQGNLYNFTIPTQEYDNDMIDISYNTTDISVAGNYSITVTFSVKNKNYTASSIEKVVYVNVVNFIELTYYQTNVSYTGKDISFALEEGQFIPQEVKVEYFVASVNGFSLSLQEIEGLTWLKTNKVMNAGIYLLKVNFITDKELLHQEYRYFMVQKATIDTSLMVFGDTTKWYTGEEISVEVGGEIPNFVSINYICKIKSTNEILETLPVEIGEYLVEVEFGFIDELYKANYNDIDPLSPITLTVRKQTLNLSRFELEQNYILTDLQELSLNQTEGSYITITLEKNALLTFRDNEYLPINKVNQVKIIANGSSLSRIAGGIETEKVFRVPSQEGTFEANITITFEKSDLYTNLSGDTITFNFIMIIV